MDGVGGICEEVQEGKILMRVKRWKQ